MAHLERFVQVKSFLTYFNVRSGTFAFQTTLSKPFSSLSMKTAMAHLEWFVQVKSFQLYRQRIC